MIISKRRALMSAATLLLASTANAISGPCDCPADLGGNGAVDFADVLQVIGAWGPCAGCPEDLDGNGAVGFSDILRVIADWGPCVFDYGPVRANTEAEQIGLEMLGPGGPLLVDDARYDRIVRDLGLIRASFPSLVTQTHTLAWAPNQIILQKVPGQPPDEYDALNACFQIVSESNFAFDFWLLTFPGKLNVERLAQIYAALDHVSFAEPNGLVGGQNFYTPVIMLNGVWRWNIDDGFHDCFDGCDCHRLYVIDVDALGNVQLISYQEIGQSWCDFGS